MTERELRELDAEIAVLVFGWHWQTNHTGKIRFLRPFDGITSTGKEPLWVHWDDGLPHYSTDRAASQEVLERCAEKCTVTVEFGRNQLSAKQFMVARLNEGGLEDWCKCAPTLPLAICLFAQKLFGKE